LQPQILNLANVETFNKVLWFSRVFFYQTLLLSGATALFANIMCRGIKIYSSNVVFNRSGSLSTEAKHAT